MVYLVCQHICEKGNWIMVNGIVQSYIKCKHESKISVHCTLIHLLSQFISMKTTKSFDQLLHRMLESLVLCACKPCNLNEARALDMSTAYFCFEDVLPTFTNVMYHTPVQCQ